MLALLASCAIASTAAAWSNKEHTQLTRLAAERLIADPKTPPDMKAWLERAIPHPLDAAGERAYFLHQRVGLITRGEDGLPYWATMPDMHALTEPPGSKVEPWGVSERNLHFIDCEYFMADESKRTYAHDLSHKPKLADFPDDAKDWRYARSGMLPFRVRECYQKLVESIRAGRLNDTPGQYPRDEHAAKWAGYLAHYSEDATQPQHATADYKSSLYFADKRKAPNVHSEVEYKMCDDDTQDYADLRELFWPQFTDAVDKFQDPIDGGEDHDPWKGTIQTSLYSYDALPLIGLAAMAATKQAGTPEHPEGPAGEFDTEVFFRFKGPCRGHEMTVLEMKAFQTAWAVRRVERLWLQAWGEAHQAK